MSDVPDPVSVGVKRPRESAEDGLPEAKSARIEASGDPIDPVHATEFVPLPSLVAFLRLGQSYSSPPKLTLWYPETSSVGHQLLAVFTRAYEKTRIDLGLPSFTAFELIGEQLAMQQAPLLSPGDLRKRISNEIRMGWIDAMVKTLERDQLGHWVAVEAGVATDEALASYALEPCTFGRLFTYLV